MGPRRGRAVREWSVGVNGRAAAGDESNQGLGDNGRGGVAILWKATVGFDTHLHPDQQPPFSPLYWQLWKSEGVRSKARVSRHAITKQISTGSSQRRGYLTYQQRRASR